MRLCFLANADPRSHSRLWIEHFAEQGHEVHWLTSFPFPPSSAGRLHMHRLPRRLGPRLDVSSHALRARRIVREISPDVLHAHYAGAYGLVAALCGFHPFVLTPWGTDVLANPEKPLLRPFIRYMVRSADLVTCNGHPMWRALEALGVASDKIRLVRWGTDLRKFTPGQRDPGSLERWFPPGSRTVISLRSLEAVYDVGTLLRAIPEVLSKVPEARFIVAGEGREQRRLMALARRLHVSHAIQVTGYIPYEELPAVVGAADVYVSTSLSDGDLAQSTQQAMACGVPVVTTDIEVNRSRIQDGENGLLVPVQQPSALARSIVRLLQDAPLRARLAEAGLRTVQQCLCHRQAMQAMGGLYGELASSRR